MPVSRLLFTVFGLRGDVLGLLRIAEGLRERGHHCTIASSPWHADLVSQSGLEFVALPPFLEGQMAPAVLEHALVDPHLGVPYVLRELVLPGLPTAIGVLSSAVRHCDAVIGNRLALVGPIAARRAGKPWILAARTPARFAPHDRVAAPDHSDVPLSDVLNLGLFANWFAPVRTGWPAHTFVSGFVRTESGAEPLPANAAAWWRDGTPPAVFALGSYAGVRGESLVDTCIDAARRTKQRAVLVGLGLGGGAASIDNEICYMERLPPRSALVSASALVHHGHVELFSEAMRAGVPQVLVPHAIDGFDLATQAEALGVAVSVARSALSVRRLVAALAEIRQERAWLAAFDLASRAEREDGAGTAVRLIERVVTTIAGHGAAETDTGARAG